MEVSFSVLRSIMKPALHVLEMGCGTGEFTKFLATIFPKVTAIDISAESALQTATKLKDYNNLTILCKDSTMTNFGNEFCDAVVLYRTLHFIKEIPLCLKEIDRLLKPGGSVYVISSPNVEVLPGAASPKETQMILGIFKEFCNITFQEQLEEYWSKETFSNFFQYCDPQEGCSRPSPSYNTEKLALVEDVVLNILDLKEVVMDSTVAKQFVAKHGIQVLEQKVQLLQKDILRCFNMSFEDMYFENVDLIIRRQYYVQIHTKPE